MNIDELLEFEDRERDRFLDVLYPQWNDAVSLRAYIQRAFFHELNDYDYQLLRQETKQGLKDGVRDFLQRHDPSPKSLYEADLYQFGLDDATESAVKSRLQRTRFAREGSLDDYCREMCQGYRGFVYNDSYNKLDEMISAEKVALSASVALHAGG